MSECLAVAFVWHMHQPSYLDPATGIMSLPWVRLHAAKDYVDMVALLEEFPAIHQTVNVTPCLVEQLAWYAAGGRDAWEQLAARPAETLSEAERAALVRQCTFAHPERMVAPFPRYAELVARVRRGQPFTPQDVRDLTVWFNLVWIDPRWRQRSATLTGLVAKGRLFTEEEKAVVLATHRELLAQVLPTYRAAQARGQLEVTTSPYTHPILPLLMDSTVARDATPGLPLPAARLMASDDVEEHLQRAVAVHTQAFGRPPQGLWPSEGSVSDAILAPVARAGFRWVATDEAILWKSLGHVPSRAALSQPYRVESEGPPLAVLFRDQTLSDLIGFTYAAQPAARAADDLLGRLHAIRQACTDPAPLVTIILDGENAWESYPEDGREFLSRLYEGLSRDPGLRCVTVSEHLAAHPPRATLPRLAAGSWIRADFTTWIGDPEKNRAWEALAQARAVWASASSAPRAEEARRHLLVAEGSDWFWWFGPEHTSAHDEEFDRLFRQRLAQVYTTLGRDVPEGLQRPISRPMPAGPVPPSGWGTPVIDGAVTDYFEWLAAGRVECAWTRGAMAPGQDRLQRLWWLCDRDRWYVRLDVAACPSEEAVTLTFKADQPAFVVAVTVQGREASGTWTALPSDHQGRGPQPLEAVAAGRIIELAVPLVGIGAVHGQAIVGQWQVSQRGTVVETFPTAGTMAFSLPKEHDAQQQWSA